MNPQNEWEENVNHHWLSLEEVKQKGDWASFVIADSTRVINVDKTQNNRIVARLFDYEELLTVEQNDTAYSIEEKLKRLKIRRGDTE